MGTVTRRFILGFLFLAVAGLGAATLPAQAQATASNGSLVGTVSEVDGGPVAGATVRAIGTVTRTAQSDAKGAFSIPDLPAGVYSVSVGKAGFETVVSQDVAVLAGQAQNVSVALQPATLTSLQTIASVRAHSRGTFNTSPASVNVISAKTFTDQAQPQVMQILNQTPGIVASYPSAYANGAVPGAITFANIRGSLSFETASLIDGHPVSVGTYGDYVTTFLNPYVLQGIEIVKGPGAAAPETNYAIGGTVNFRTKDPTFKPSGNITLGADTFGGLIYNFGYSGTSGKIGWVLDYAENDTQGPFANHQAWFEPDGGTIGSNSIVYQDWKDYSQYPNNVYQGSVPYNSSSLLACCQRVVSSYKNQTELVKLRYAFSGSTVATLSYLGSQTAAGETADGSSQTYFTFNPASAGGYTPSSPPAPYTGSLTPGTHLINSPFFPINTSEVNNEPIFQGEIRTSVGHDSLVARAYAASIKRLTTEGGDNPNNPVTENLSLFGTEYDYGGNPIRTFNGESMPVAFYAYYHEFEMDALKGYSFEYVHPIGENALTVAYNHTHSATYAGEWAYDPYNTPNVDADSFVPNGSTQDFGTLLLRGHFYMGAKFDATLSGYLNTYRSTYAVDCVGGCPQYANPTPLQYVFNTGSSAHVDGRVGLEYRPTPTIAARFSFGSAIAPPYLALLSQVPGQISYNATTQIASQTSNAGNLRPETAFGYDLGGDIRSKNGVDSLSLDFYLTNLFNQFIQQSSLIGTCVPTGSGSSAGCAVGPGSPQVPLYGYKYVNLTNARYEGIEFAARHEPAVGLGYLVQGALLKAYPYNMGPCFYYSQPPCSGTPTNNLAVIPNQNFHAGVGGLANGVSNQSVPNAQGYAEVHYQSPTGYYASFGETYFGNNNSLMLKPFVVANGTFRMPLQPQTSIQVSAFNLFNTHSGLFPINGAGVPITLANGQIGVTSANVIGPRRVTLMFVENFGGSR